MSGNRDKNTAVVGTGWFGRAHARVLNEISNLKAICDINPDLTKKLARVYGINSYLDHEKLIKEESLDAVSIVLPPKIMPEVARDFAEAGIDVLIEKPMGIKLQPVENLIKYEKNVRMTCGFIELFNPVVKRARELLPEIGEILNVSSRRIGRFPRRWWNLGVVLDLGVHEIYIQQSILGSVSNCYSTVDYFNDPEKKFEDAAFIILEFENKKHGFIELNWLTPIKFRRMTIYGSEGVLEVDYSTQELRKIYSGGEGNSMKYELISQPYVFDEPLKNELNAFLYSEKNPVPLSEGIKSLKVALKILNQDR
ncbi:MAG: Gfo/Idh/MocA family protein [Candidatus Helarchaeales archaeon]